MPIFNLAYGWGNTPTPTPAEFTDWDAWVISSVTAELWRDIDSTILHLFWDEFYVSLDDDIGNWDSLYELWRIYDTIANDNEDWYWLQISDWWDMTDINHIKPYGNLATDAVCIVWDNDDWSDAQYLVWTPNWLHSFSFQFSSLASHFSGKDTVCMFIFNY